MLHPLERIHQIFSKKRKFKKIRQNLFQICLKLTKNRLKKRKKCTKNKNLLIFITKTWFLVAHSPVKIELQVFQHNLPKSSFHPIKILKIYSKIQSKRRKRNQFQATLWKNNTNNPNNPQENYLHPLFLLPILLLQNFKNPSFSNIKTNKSNYNNNNNNNRMYRCILIIINHRKFHQK